MLRYLSHRNWQNLTFYRSDKETVYQHIDLLFKDVINWERIAKECQ
jgi:hypothetical protein